MPPSQPSQTYEIIDGVRRAKAASDAGRKTIPAQIDGQQGVVDIPITDLLSPHKQQIDTTLPGGSVRFNRIVRAVGNLTPLPPILVHRGSRGIPVSQVQVI